MLFVVASLDLLDNKIAAKDMDEITLNGHVLTDQEKLA